MNDIEMEAWKEAEMSPPAPSYGPTPKRWAEHGWDKALSNKGPGQQDLPRGGSGG